MRDDSDDTGTRVYTSRVNGVITHTYTYICTNDIFHLHYYSEISMCVKVC